ncbi:MAG: adenylate/guanylate cyclase domain-containing protein [Solirubrobacteraceae bacterium]
MLQTLADLLHGLGDEAAGAREQLLERLLADGFSDSEIRAAAAEDRLTLLPVERTLGGRYSAREIEARTGLPAGLMLRIRRLQGLPEAGTEDRVFGDADVEAFRSARLFLEAGLSEQALAEITRVLGEAMARVTATTIAGFVEAFLHAGDSEAEVAERFATLAEELTPAVSPVLVASFTAHLREGVHRGMLRRADLERGGAPGEQELSVCFADLVGFTRLGGEIQVEELGTVAGRLAELAGEVTSAPARLVKTIGDAAMFVSPDPGTLVEVALRLLSAAEEAELPTLRSGIACGTAIQRAGDFFGHSVNLASRVTGAARPGSVLCTQEVRDAAPEDFDWSFAGKHRLKGVAQAVALHRARPLGSEPRPRR